jgi:hypothetical protein
MIWFEGKLFLMAINDESRFRTQMIFMIEPKREREIQLFFFRVVIERKKMSRLKGLKPQV